MEVITCNILHLGVIASEDDFQREVWRVEKEWATVICKGFTNLLNRICESLFTACSIPSRQSLMKYVHKQVFINNSHWSRAQGLGFSTIRESELAIFDSAVFNSVYLAVCL